MKHLLPLLMIVAMMGCRAARVAPVDAVPAPAASLSAPIEEQAPVVRRLEVVAPETEDAKIAASLVRIRVKFIRPGETEPQMVMTGGTGFAVSDLVIGTAAHVIGVDPGDLVLGMWVILPDGTEVMIRSAVIGPGDVAMVTLAKPHGLPCLPIAASMPEAWSPALTVGWPELQKWIVSVRGHARRAPDEVVHPQLVSMGGGWAELTLPLLRGMSGSPILVNGEVVAVVSCDPPGPHTFGARCDKQIVAEAERARATAERAKADAEAARPAPREAPAAPQPAPPAKPGSGAPEKPGAPADCAGGT